MIVVSGCSSVQGTPTPTTSGGPSAAGSDTDVSECFDGQCELTVTDTVRVPLDNKFGITSLSAEVIGPEQVRVSYSGFGGTGNATLRRTGAVDIGGVTIRVISIDAGTAKLRLSER